MVPPPLLGQTWAGSPAAPMPRRAGERPWWTTGEDALAPFPRRRPRPPPQRPLRYEPQGPKFPPPGGGLRRPTAVGAARMTDARLARNWNAPDRASTWSSCSPSGNAGELVQERRVPPPPADPHLSRLGPGGHGEGPVPLGTGGADPGEVGAREDPPPGQLASRLSFPCQRSGNVRAHREAPPAGIGGFRLQVLPRTGPDQGRCRMESENTILAIDRRIGVRPATEVTYVPARRHETKGPPRRHKRHENGTQHGVS
jgi:hypothetical protein